VEVMGRYLNHSDQGECLRTLLAMVPSGSKTAKTRTPRRVCRRLEPSKVEELIQGYSDGAPVDELAGRFQVDQSTVQKHARRHGLPRRSPRLGPNQTEEAITLYTEGQSLLKLANHFGVASDTVARALRRAGITLRPRRGWTR
jgi:transposase-like protein